MVSTSSAGQLEHLLHVADVRMALAKSPADKSHWAGIHCRLTELVAESGYQWKKLRRDLEKLKGDPQSPDLAFNFFVTAEHMLDWVYPKRVNNQKRTDARNNSTLLQVCSHLANGVKHLEVEGKRHDSVKSAAKPGCYFEAACCGEGLRLDDAGRFLSAAG